MGAVVEVILLILRIYYWVVLATVIMSWLISFNVINTRNDFVQQVWRTLRALTDPVLRPIRRVIPPVGGLDLSPIILFIILFFLEVSIVRYVAPNVF